MLFAFFRSECGRWPKTRTRPGYEIGSVKAPPADSGRLLEGSGGRMLVHLCQGSTLAARV